METERKEMDDKIRVAVKEVERERGREGKGKRG